MLTLLSRTILFIKKDNAKTEQHALLEKQTKEMMVSLFLTLETDSLKEMPPQQLLHLLLLPLMPEPLETQLNKLANTTLDPTPAPVNALEPNLKSLSVNPRNQPRLQNAQAVPCH